MATISSLRDHSQFRQLQTNRNESLNICLYMKIDFQFKVGVQVFLVLFETQPNMKRTFRQYRGKKHSELRINEDLQQLIMYLMSILKRIVKHINDTRTIVKYLRRLAKKHSPLEVDLGR